MSPFEIKFSEAINRAISHSMTNDDGVICFGLGVTDPKNVFGTTTGLLESFGEHRVFDVPCSENALTGIGIGASIGGIKPIMVHQRLDFFLLAMDQLVNNAAKWHYMFGSQSSVPITIRLILGRGWGQGPTHSQNLQAWFAHIPGLKVVSPSNALDASQMLLASIFDPNPVVFLEHRWLHNSSSIIPDHALLFAETNLNEARIIEEGEHISLIGSSYMVPEMQRAAEYVKNIFSITCDVIDLRTIRPIDWGTIFKSVQKTGRVLSIDCGATSFSVSSEIITSVAENIKLENLHSLDRLGLPDIPEPTSFELTKNYYNDASSIVKKICEIFSLDAPAVVFQDPELHDIPGDWFKGPF